MIKGKLEFITKTGIIELNIENFNMDLKFKNIVSNELKQKAIELMETIREFENTLNIKI